MTDGGAAGLVGRASALAECLVRPLGRRWRHVEAVARRAVELRGAVPRNCRDELVAAAWLHDIGYSPGISSTGFHPLDGARYLREHGWPTRVVNLVAQHSGARFEARERGLSAELAEFGLAEFGLAEFGFGDSALLDALAAADLTVGPDGQALAYDERTSEILARYPAQHPVHRAWLVAGPELAKAVARTEARLQRSPKVRATASTIQGVFDP